MIMFNINIVALVVLGLTHLRIYLLFPFIV